MITNGEQRYMLNALSYTIDSWQSPKVLGFSHLMKYNLV